MVVGGGYAAFGGSTEDGERIATLRPTCFLEEAGAAAPITLGGQALLADAGID